MRAHGLIALALAVGALACDEDEPGSAQDAAGLAQDTGTTPGADAQADGGAPPADSGPAVDSEVIEEPEEPEEELPPVDWQTPAQVHGAHADVPPFNAACRHHWVGGIRGWVADQTGRPAPGARAQACMLTQPGDMLICLRPEEVDAQGAYSIKVPANAACTSQMAMRILRSNEKQATNYCLAQLDLTGPDHVLRLEDPQVVYATQRAEVPSLTPDDQAHWVRYVGDLEVAAVPNVIYPTSGSFAQTRARAVDPTDRGLCFIDREAPPDRLWAFWPEAAIDGPSFDLRMPNDLGLPPGGEVDLFVLGGLECNLEDETHIPEGEWRAYGVGKVTADGQHIVNEPGSGLPCFSWFGYRVRR